jgi:hypothetical protein
MFLNYNSLIVFDSLDQRILYNPKVIRDSNFQCLAALDQSMFIQVYWVANYNTLFVKSGLYSEGAI